MNPRDSSSCKRRVRQKAPPEELAAREGATTSLIVWLLADNTDAVGLGARVDNFGRVEAIDAGALGRLVVISSDTTDRGGREARRLLIPDFPRPKRVGGTEGGTSDSSSVSVTGWGSGSGREIGRR